jgi:hypothetical protein
MRLANLREGSCLKRAAKYGTLLALALLLTISTALFFLPSPALAAPTIFPTVLPSGQVGTPYSTVLLAAPITPPVAWAVTGGTLPAGLTLDAPTGTISGTPTTAGTYNFIVQATDATGPSPQQGFSIVIAATPITFNTTSLLQAKECVAYSTKIVVSGGKSPYTYSLSGGALPSGLTLTANSGTISGTPDKGTAGDYVFTIGVTDSSSPPLSASRSFTLTVIKGFFDTVVTITSSLAAGETNVYVDDAPVAELGGGETTSLSFAVGAKPVITVDTLVSDPTQANVRFKPDIEEITVSEASPNATFTFFPEYFVSLATDPPQIASLAGSSWYKGGTALRSTAQAEVDKEEGTQYRFSYWLLPTGEKFLSADLSWLVSAGGRVVATYDTYYMLTVTSPQGTVDGNGWYKSGAAAKWSISPAEVPMSGILGFLQGKLKPEEASDTEVMDAPQTIAVDWKPDYTMPAIIIPLAVFVIVAVVFGVRRILYPPAPKPVPAPAPPTILVLDGGKGGLDSTKEQLVAQFRNLLEKYEGEVKTSMESEESPEAKLLPASQGAPSPKEAASCCGYTAKKLLRTVVGRWHKKEEKIVPPSEEKEGGKGVTTLTIWGRDIYNEWQVFTCSLPPGHSGKHKGTTTIAYSVQDSVTEERTYTTKQKIVPPRPHFTDELPRVDVVPSQVITPESTETFEEVIPPDDEIIPPEE